MKPVQDFVTTLEENMVPFVPNMSPDAPPRFEPPGLVIPLTEAVYDYFLELVGPRIMARWYFASCEGAGTFRLFWKKGRDFYGAELTEEQTESFCQITGACRDNC